MPIEVTTSPSIADTFHSYHEFSYQRFAKVSRTAPVANWITQEQAIVMEDPATDVSVLHRCHQGCLLPFGFCIFFFGQGLMSFLLLLAPH